MLTDLILPCGMSVENAGKGFEPPHEQESAANHVKNSYNETGEPPVKKPDRPSTPNVKRKTAISRLLQVVKKLLKSTMIFIRKKPIVYLPDLMERLS